MPGAICARYSAGPVKMKTHSGPDQTGEAPPDLRQRVQRGHRQPGPHDLPRPAALEDSPPSADTGSSGPFPLPAPAPYP